MNYHPLRHNEGDPKWDNGMVITLAGQDLAHAVQLYLEEKFNVDALGVCFKMEKALGEQTATVQALVRVQERKKPDKKVKANYAGVQESTSPR